MTQSRNRTAAFKLAIVWMGIILLGSFWLTARSSGEPLSLVMVPQVPREGEPIIVTFKLSNPSSRALAASYQFYAGGQLLKDGSAVLAPVSGRTYQYAYRSSLKLGEQLNFVLRLQREQRNYERITSSPAYPPQVWSSFVSFASFATSMMSFMSSTTYYRATFEGLDGFNIGVLLTIVLIALLIFLELSQPAIQEKDVRFLGRIKARFTTLTWILFIIFAGIVYTKIVMLLAG